MDAGAGTEEGHGMKQLTYEDGIIRLGDEELPGLLSHLRIEGRVRFDEQKVDGASGKKKTPQGWEDQVVSINLTLLTDDDSTCYEKLEKLVPFFKTPDDNSNPQIYALANRHGQARGMRQVVFDRLESSESNREDVIRVYMTFVEHNPPIVRTEEASAKSPTPGELAEKALAEASTGPEEHKVIIGVE
jgi:hypothetical protein